MLRRLATLVALGGVTLVGPPQPTSMRDTYAEAIRIDTMPVTLVRDEPDRVRIGNLTLIGGWRLTSRSPQFGGWSSLAVKGDRFTAVGDAGSVLRFRLTQLGLATDARIDPLPRGCGRTDDKRHRDSEAAARLPGGDWLVAFEFRNAICRTSPDFGVARAVAAPAAMRGWRRASGPESMTALPDGRVVVIAEGSPERSSRRPLIVFDRDPTRRGARAVRYAYRPPVGFDPTEIAALPDGRWLVLDRRFAPGALFTVKLSLVDARGAAPGSILSGRVLAHFARPVLNDNYEAIAVTVEAGRPIVWLMSDDNFFAWQGTYLLKLAIDPGALAEVAPRQAAASAGT